MEKKSIAKDVDSILKGIIIPSPPQIIADLQMEMAKSDPDLNEIGSLIANDAGLSGAVIKTANSPVYAKSKEISSISQAVMMLGTKTLVDIVNTLCLRNATVDQNTMSDNVYSTLIRFWDSAADVAKVCEMVAQKLRMSSLGNAYMLGLFHNVGIALLISKHDNYLDVIADSYSQSDERIVDVENKAFNSNHAVVSYYAAKSWKLDKLSCKVIAKHHNEDVFSKSSNIEVTDEHNLLSVLKIAEHIVGLHRILGNQEVDHEWEKIGENLLYYVGLTSYDMDDLKSEAVDKGFGEQLYFR